MIEPQEILGYIRLLLSSSGPLNGRRILVTAGGTQEPIDPVRVIANRSSGKQGFALAQAALDAGAQVTLISVPSALPSPSGAKRVDVQTAEEMLQAVLEEVPHTDALLMAAAVADFRPANPAINKLKKEAGVPAIQLERTSDILAAVAHQKETSGHPIVTVGFAAESQDLLENAQAKLSAKKLDFIAANDIRSMDAGFSVDTNRVTLLYSNGDRQELPLMSKTQVAEVIVQEVVRLLEINPAGQPDFLRKG